MKTRFDSYCINGIADGCKYCVKGKKLVLFITGKCLRACSYCSLSTKRKNKDIIWANERKCSTPKDLLEEVRKSNATSAGITGGDPFLFLSRTLKYAKILKKNFKNFHIHIYLPTEFSDESRLKKLSRYIDEIRFHPSFLVKNSIEKGDIEKIKQAGLYFSKKNIGCELPLIPDRKKEILEFIKIISPYVGFVNLNEFEFSDTNMEYILKNYKLNKDTYTIKGSKEAGLWILNKAKKLKLKIHLCTAGTKNCYQYRNRLKLHSVLPYGYRTKDGTVVYFAIYSDNIKSLFNKLKKYEIYLDKAKNRINISADIVHKLIKNYKIAMVEELPSFDRTEVEFEYLSEDNHLN